MAPAEGSRPEAQRPLAAVVVAGLATAITSTLLVLPTVYSWFAAGAGGRQTTDLGRERRRETA